MNSDGGGASGLTGRQQIGLAITLALLTLLGTVVANWNQIFPPSTPSTSGPTPTTRVEVQNIYNIPEARGLQILRGQGFTAIRLHRVCSNSVAAGNVREVVLDNNAPTSDETALVNQLGSTGIMVPLETKLVVKISKGACP